MLGSLKFAVLQFADFHFPQIRELQGLPVLSINSKFPLTNSTAKITIQREI